MAMDAQEFIDAIRLVVRDAAIEDTKTLVTDPPGRGYPKMVEARAAWVRSLDADGRRHLDSIIAFTAHATVFGFLCVLDGVRAIEDGTDKGGLELIHHGSDGQTLLNGPNTEMLHDIYDDNPSV
jgi:hypothetical protein